MEMNKAFALGFTKAANEGFEDFFGHQKRLAKSEPPSHKKVLTVGGGLGAATGALIGGFSPEGGSAKGRVLKALGGAALGGLGGVGIGEALRSLIKSDITMAKGIMKAKRPRQTALETYADILGERIADLEGQGR